MINRERWNKHRRQFYLTVNGRAGRMCSAAKLRAKQNNLKFDLDVKWITKKINQGHCEMTGMKFTLEAPRKGYFHNPYAPSLDRHNQTKGYTKDNVKVVIWAYNQAKGQWNRKHFKRIIKAIYKGMFNNEQKIKRAKDIRMAKTIQRRYRVHGKIHTTYDY